MPVNDRTLLILEIFAQRARSHEGKLQVELARLQYLSTRLVRRWSHLERQQGGIGMRGPGETQLETDRRLLRIRIENLKERLEKVRQTRAQGRAARQKAGMPTVSLVGYTNAGKSTLFNALTGDATFASNQLFATLDTTLRKIHDEVFLTPGVDRAWVKSLWAPGVRWTEVTEEGFRGGPVMPDSYDGSPQAVEQLRQNIARSGIVGSLVANNFKSSMIFVPLLDKDPRTGQRIDLNDAFSHGGGFPCQIQGPRRCSCGTGRAVAA